MKELTESDVYPLLKDLAGGRVYPYVVKLTPEGVPAVDPPWLVFSIISQAVSDVLCGPAESASAVQIDVWARTLAEARAIRSQAADALKPLAPSQLQLMQELDETTGLSRAMLEVQITT